MTRDISTLDFSKVAALQQKRTLAFVNHFVTTTVQFLNNFSKQCEQKLMFFERKLEKVEAALILLEARLSSIPEVNADENKVVEPKRIDPEQENNDSTAQTEAKTEVTIDAEQKAAPSYPEYDRFMKMVQVGVPLPAVKLKLSTEGLDPDVLEKILNRQI